MKIGLFLNSQWQPGVDLAVAFDDLLRQVAVARDSGFSSVWVGQHFVAAPIRLSQPLPLLARIAADAEGMTLGTAILLLPMLNPVQLAKEVATLDWLCGGRFVLGAGLGYRPEEFAAMGAPFDRKVGRLREAIALLRKLWTEERVSHQGRHFTVEGVGASIRPKQPGGPPIWMAGEVEPAIRRAAALADCWLPMPVPTLPELQRLFDVYKAARAASGQPLPKELPLFRECHVGATSAQAVATAQGPLQTKYQSYAAWGHEESAATGNRVLDDFPAFARDRFVLGDEAQVRDELQRYRDTLGIGHFCMRMQWYGMAQEPVLKSIERLGRVAASLR